jgi:hypothetical protein
MQKQKYSKLGLITCIAILAASIHVHADMATASGILADIAAKTTQANNTLAAAAASGNQEAIIAAQAQVNAVATASQDAVNAYTAMEQAGGNDPAAEQQIQEAQNAAATAMGATPPAETPAPGGQGNALPNPDTILWESPQLQQVYQSLFNIVQSASAQGGTEFAEFEATSI